MHVKVRNGTVRDGGSSLCTTCRFSTIVRGRSLDEEIIQCHVIALRATLITFKVTSCSSYSDQRLPTYMEMMEDAWILQPGSKRRPAGFVRASDLRQDELTNVLADIRRREDP